MKVLVVEDDATQRYAITYGLSDEHEVAEFSKPIEALENSDGFDVAILDLMIKDDISGTTLAGMLKEKHPNMKIIIYTALVGGLHRTEAEMVADVVITKRNEMDVIAKTLKGAIYGITCGGSGGR